VRNKFLLRLREDNASVAVKCGFDERDFRLQADPRTFFVTDHYRGYPSVLIHLSQITPSVFREVMEETWRRNAPKSLVKQFDAAGRRAGGQAGRRAGGQAGRARIARRSGAVKRP
jgi:hypothetical protein